MHLTTFTNIDSDNGFYIDIEQAFEMGKQNMFDVTAVSIYNNIKSAFRSLAAREGETVSDWIERFTKTVLSNSTTQSNYLFVVSADTEENRFSIINTMENAMRADFIDPDELIILWS